jgi:hypothetical protein
MGCFRYVTPVLKGRWWPSREEALAEALAAGQAFVASGEVRLFEFASLEERPGASFQPTRGGRRPDAGAPASG